MQKAFKSLRASVNLHITQGHTDRGWNNRFQPRFLSFCALDLLRVWKKETKKVNIAGQAEIADICVEYVTTKWQSSVIKCLPAVSEGHGYIGLFIHPRLFLALSSLCMFKTLRAAVEICIWGSSNLNITQHDDSYAGGELHSGWDGMCHEGLLSIRWMPWYMWMRVKTSGQYEWMRDVDLHREA